MARIILPLVKKVGIWMQVWFQRLIFSQWNCDKIWDQEYLLPFTS